MNKRLKRITSIIFSLLIISEVNSQTSAYHSIVFPYDLNNYQIMTSGGTISAKPDPNSSIQLNPAGLAFIDQSALLFNHSYHTVKYSINYDYLNDGKSSNAADHYPGFFSVIIPLMIADKKIVISSAVQGIQSPEIDIWNEIYPDQELYVYHNRTGAVSKIDFAISGQPVKNLGIGFGISKWSGNWRWYDQSEYEIFNASKFNYTGTSFNLGLLYQWKRLKMGISFYSPFQLMSSSLIYTDLWWSYYVPQYIKQKFDGAVRTGLLYHLTPKWSIGIDYRWQNKITIKNIHTEKNILTDSLIAPYNSKYSDSHQISVTLEKDFHWKSIELPFFIAYQLSLLPETPESNYRNYQQIEINSRNNDRHSIYAGINMLYKSYGLYLAAGWETGSVHIDDRSGMLPPWS